MLTITSNVAYLKSEETEDKIEKILKLKKLLDDGAITQSEYDQLKTEIVQSSSNAEGSNVKQVQKSDSINGYQFVDLGLPSGTLWAACNVGATKPEGTGGYYAWGELETKSRYGWSTYKWYTSDGRPIKYLVGSINSLQKEDDVANMRMSEPWEMPTFSDFKELRKYCTWIWSDINGVAGFTVIAENGNSIFFPAVGYYSGKYKKEYYKTPYWTSTLNGGDSSKAYTLYFSHRGARVSSQERSLGLNIRAVVHKKK